MAGRGGSSRRLAIAIDMGGTKILAGLVGPRGKVRAARRDAVVAASRDGLLRQLAAIIQDLRHAVPAGSSVAGLGVAVPGAVAADGTVWAPNLPGWRDVPLARLLERATGLRAIVRDDRLTSLLGEHWLGAARGVRSAAFITIGTGIGVGFMSNGQFWTGAHGVAGSAGWWALGQTRSRRASRIGVLESQVAGPAILTRMRRSRLPGASVRDLVLAARRGIPRAGKVLTETSGLIGLAIANLVSVLDPELIVVGGGVMQGGGLPLAPIRRIVRRYAQPLARAVPIRRSALGSRASFFGAAALVYRSTTMGGKDARVS
jgi:glucokinase